MPSPSPRHRPTAMRNASTGPASHGVQLSRERWSFRVHGWEIEDLWRFFFSVCMSIIVRTTNRGLLSSVGVLALQKSLVLFSLGPRNKRRQMS